MTRFILKRLLQAVPVLFIIATLTFFMVRLAPGGPFTEEKTIPAEIQKRIEEHYGLDRPLWEQYLLYFGILAKEVHKERVNFEPDESAKEVVVKDANATLRVHRSGKVEDLNGAGPWLSRLSPNLVVVVFQQEGEPAREVNQQPLTFKPGEQEQVLDEIAGQGRAHEQSKHLLPGTLVSRPSDYGPQHVQPDGGIGHEPQNALGSQLLDGLVMCLVRESGRTPR